MKVAWVSNSPWAGTGYGQQTALALPRLAERYGADNVAMLSLYGLSGGPLKLNGIQHYPTGYHPYSDDVLTAHVEHFLDGDQGIAITLFDVWIFENPLWKELPLVAAWTPIDHAPVPPRVLKFFHRTGAAPIAMSKFGAEWLRKAGLDPLYVPHAVDVSTMRPTPELAGVRCGEIFGIDADRYVVGMVAANKGVLPNRKSFPEAFQAFAEWRDTDAAQALERRPLLYVHTDPFGGGQGIDLHIVANACGLKIGDDILFADPYVTRMPAPNQVMAALYSSFDVLLMPSMGEGFGVPAIEAQACGTPVIVSDFSAQPELVGAGWKVSGDPFYDPAQDAWLFRPHVGSVVDALTQCAARDVDQVAADCHAAVDVAADYEVDRVWREHWEPTLDTLERLVPTAAPIQATPTARKRAA